MSAWERLVLGGKGKGAPCTKRHDAAREVSEVRWIWGPYDGLRRMEVRWRSRSRRDSADFVRFLLFYVVLRFVWLEVCRVLVRRRRK